MIQKFRRKFVSQFVVFTSMLTILFGATHSYAGDNSAKVKIFVIEASNEGPRKIDSKLKSLASNLRELPYKNYKVVKSKKVQLKMEKLKELKFRLDGKSHTLKMKLKSKQNKKIKFRIMDKKLGVSTTVKMKVGKMFMIKGKKKGKIVPFIIFKAVK